MRKREKKDFRSQFIFWLNLFDKKDNAIAEYLDTLKEKRLYASTIRNGILLMQSLRNKDLTLLFELFPFVNEYIHEQIMKGISDGGKSEIKKLEDHLMRLEKTIFNNGGYVAPSNNYHMDSAEPMPEFEIKVTKSDKIPAYESMISGVKLSGKFHKLPPEVARYAVKMGRLEASQLPQLQEEKKEEILPVIAAQEIKPKAHRFSFNRK